MILSINTSSEKNSGPLYQKGKVLNTKIWQGYGSQSQDLLMEIEKLLKKERKKLQNIEAIAVLQGPGSFTGLRVGISVANTLGWSLDIPVMGIKGDAENFDAETIAEIAGKKLTKIKTKKFSKIVTPFYNRILSK